MTAEEDLNDCLGRRGQHTKDTAGQHTRCHSASQIVTPMMFFTNTKALEMIEDFQRRSARWEVSEIISVERQRQVHRLAKDLVGQKLELKAELEGDETTEDT